MMVTPVKAIELILGVILILAIIEALRRAVSPVMALLVVIFLLYLPFGEYMPTILYHKAFSLSRIIEGGFLSSGAGVFGLLMGTSATHIILFIIFGSFVFAIGAGEFFTDFSRALAGASVGGPAKIATLSSCLFGTLTGSAVANVYATGTFTIPLMKRQGFKAEFAGAVEAATSTGGQIMPPIMGAAAFLVADNLTLPYIQVALCALIPAILYYFSIWMMIDFRCRRENLKGENRESLPRMKDIIMRSYLFLPIVALFAMLCMGYSPLLACFSTILTCVVLSFFRKDTCITPKRLLLIFEDAGKSASMVAVAVAGAGLIVMSVTQSGLALTIGSMILSLGFGIKFLILIMIAIVTIILGMGVPTTAAYVISAALGVSPLVQLGVKPMAAHLFILYFAVMSNVTPPVAIAAYAGANIAESEPMRTGFEAFKVAMAGYIVPFMFVYSPILVLQEGNLSSILYAAVTAALGVVLLAGSLQGWLLFAIPLWGRMFVMGASIALIHPGVVTDVIGFITASVIVACSRYRHWNRAKPI